MLKYLYKKYFDKGKYQIISQNISDAEMPTYYAFGFSYYALDFSPKK